MKGTGTRQERDMESVELFFPTETFIRDNMRTAEDMGRYDGGGRDSSSNGSERKVKLGAQQVPFKKKLYKHLNTIQELPV